MARDTARHTYLHSRMRRRVVDVVYVVGNTKIVSLRICCVAPSAGSHMLYYVVAGPGGHAIGWDVAYADGLEPG